MLGKLYQLYQKSKYSNYLKRLKSQGVLTYSESSIIEGSSFLSRVPESNFMNFRVGERCMITGNFVTERQRAKITIGDDTFIGGGSFIAAESISIGSNVMFSWGCTVIDTNAHALDSIHRSNDVALWLKGAKEGQPGKYKNWNKVETLPVIIEDKVWVGFNVVILKGVTIGEGAVVAAASVVTKSVSPYTMVGGNPAKEIRKLNRDDDMGRSDSLHSV